MTYVLVGTLGLIIGSFFNVVLSRFGKEGIVRGRSHCPECKHVIPWRDLIPVVSFIILRGRCRFCGTAISIRYPVVELLSGLLLVLVFLNYGFSAMAMLWGASALLLLLLAFFDGIYFILPDSIVLLVGITGLINALLFHPESLVSSFVTGFLLSFLFAILYVVSNGSWIGFGDVKLVFVLGFLLGYPHAVLITVGAIWLATAVGLGLILLRRAHWKTALPFGAFLSSTAIIGILLYEQLSYFRFIF